MKIENILQKQTPQSERDSTEYKINKYLAKKFSRLEAKPSTQEKSELC